MTYDLLDLVSYGLRAALLWWAMYLPRVLIHPYACTSFSNNTTITWVCATVCQLFSAYLIVLNGSGLIENRHIKVTVKRTSYIGETRNSKRVRASFHEFAPPWTDTHPSPSFRTRAIRKHMSHVATPPTPVNQRIVNCPPEGIAQ